ncbi:MAG: hypothetical protein AB2776_18805 [Candidatus Thiodiazotropha endolucinida]
MNNMQGLLGNPIFNMGIGLLAERGQPRGLLAGLQLAQRANYQNALMKSMEQKQALALKAQEEKENQQAALTRLAKEYTATPIPGSGPISQNPQPAYALNPMAEDMAVGAPDMAEAIMQKIMEAKMVPVPPKVTDDMAEYKLSQQDPAFAQYLKDIGSAGASRTNITIGGKDLTPGQKKLDEIYAQQFADFGPGGQFADSKRMIRQIGEARDMLANNDNLTGPIVGHIPDWLLSFVNPESLSVREGAEEVIQRNLRAILGPQFTEKEGERLIARAYNDKLSEAENIKRLDRVFTQMADAYNVKKSAADYFFKNGTLRGWEGKLPTIDDFYSVLSNTNSTTSNNDPLGLR